MKRKWILSALAVTSMTIAGNAQQAATYTQHGQMRTMLNPAASLLRAEGEIAVIGRRQWVGVDGAPSVFWGSGHVGLAKFGASAGLNIRHESLAVEQLTEASAFFAKSVRISETEYLGLSLNAGLSYQDGRFSQLDPMDPAFREDIRNASALVGFAVMLYRPERYYVGLSLPRLTLGNLGVGEANRYNFRNRYHLTAGALFALDTDFHFRPSLLVTYAENLRPQAEISALVFIKQIVGVGTNIRSYGDIAGLAHINIGKLGFGYSYQFNPGNEPMNRRIGNSTHEIGIGYRFGTALYLL